MCQLKTGKSYNEIESNACWLRKSALSQTRLCQGAFFYALPPPDLPDWRVCCHNSCQEKNNQQGGEHDAEMGLSGTLFFALQLYFNV